jgi:hypothetical protein
MYDDTKAVARDLTAEAFIDSPSKADIMDEGRKIKPGSSLKELYGIRKEKGKLFT